MTDPTPTLDDLRKLIDATSMAMAEAVGKGRPMLVVVAYAEDEELVAQVMGWQLSKVDVPKMLMQTAQQFQVDVVRGN